MRVFLYTPFYPPQAQAAAVRCYWLSETLRNAGHEVRVVSSIETPQTSSLTLNPADNKQSFLKRLVFEVVAGIELFFEILFSSYDLYILSSPPFITISIAHLACRLRSKKYVIDVRDIYPDVYFAQKLIKEDSLIGRAIKTFTKRMYEHSHGVSTVNPGLIQKIKKLAPATSRIELLINGYDEEIFKPSVEKYEKFTVMFHGTMGKIQDLKVILDVAKNLEKHEDIEFVFIGEGPQAELLKVSSLKNIKYLGPKAYQDIPGLVSKAHVGFSARRDDEIGSDAFPVKAFEYLGVGIPVILCPKSGMANLVKEGLYEFENSKIEEISQKILELKNSRAQVFVPMDFSRQKISKKILSFCDF